MIKSSGPDDDARIYGAMLYWKLYSQHTLRKKIVDWAHRAREPFGQLLAALPPALEGRPAGIVKLVTQIGRFSGPGMESGIAVRATLLHFLYPDIAPLFDRMVLRAVGIHSETASKDKGVFEEYISYVWSLAERYRQECLQFKRETPIRVIDMALWVTRGKAAASRAVPRKPFLGDDVYSGGSTI